MAHEAGDWHGTVTTHPRPGMSSLKSQLTESSREASVYKKASRAVKGRRMHAEACVSRSRGGVCYNRDKASRPVATDREGVCVAHPNMENGHVAMHAELNMLNCSPPEHGQHGKS